CQLRTDQLDAPVRRVRADDAGAVRPGNAIRLRVSALGEAGIARGKRVAGTGLPPFGTEFPGENTRHERGDGRRRPAPHHRSRCAAAGALSRRRRLRPASYLGGSADAGRDVGALHRAGALVAPAPRAPRPRRGALDGAVVVSERFSGPTMLHWRTLRSAT